MEADEEEENTIKWPQKRTRKRKACDYVGPVYLANEESKGAETEEEEEAHLSDLDGDVEEYILTEKEVSLLLTDSPSSEE